ncbi:PLP-dependent transferase [Xylona heveae TC161]|uniref:PLP-dependent transferase n=1 Tax=Xylona heveae (strain CBS 132557 / TC161) TaxID=1328760 RepID=A0A165FGL2_XYLHT|nr:PLP-dependent transferase [Xylona heveae TC161]KZF20953.1 PLP-dependent transferase [Xylona heveae TC161]
MPLPVPPPLGYPVPYSRHAVSVQLPTWQDMCGMAQGEPRVKRVQRIGYPRSFLQKDVQALIDTAVEIFGTAKESCLIFPSFSHAAACGAFIRSHISSPESINGEYSVRAVDFPRGAASRPQSCSNHVLICTAQSMNVRLFAVFFPTEFRSTAIKFWRLTGTGISSRLAEDLLTSNTFTKNVFLPLVTDANPFRKACVEDAADIIKCRIANLLGRTLPSNSSKNFVDAADVYLYPSGMSAIYHCNQLLNTWRGTQSIVFGFPYELTLKLVETFGTSCKFFGFGTPDELQELEQFLEIEAENGRSIQAIWCECPSNPLLRTVDLDRIRQLADQFNFPVVVDETIGTFANVDLLQVADVIVTSLTKSFSGYLDVMAGSIALNPSSRFYKPFKKALDSSYRNELYAADAIQLECNSRDFLARAGKMNETAATLVSHLETFISNPESALTKIYYPSQCWSVANYQARMRPSTPEFYPGYGCLFTLDFADVEAATVFFDTLDVHKGPSLGGNLTLAQPYVQTVFFREKDWAAQFGLRETIVRVSVGLEDAGELLATFDKAVRKARKSTALNM